MEQEVLLKNGMDLVYLSRCALREETPELDRVEYMDLEAVHALAQRHSMTAITAYAMERFTKAYPDAQAAQHPVLAIWNQEKLLAIRKNLLLDVEREKILAHLEEMGCWYMPLKGVFMQHIYPKAGMRQMSDNDILINPDFRKAVQKFMQENGYEAKKMDTAIHDEFTKKPLYVFEMHVALASDMQNRQRAAYYRNVKEKLVKDADNARGYHFTDEDFYVYMNAHAFKHYEVGGNGIRSLMDVYQYLSQKGDSLDRTYIDGELKELGIFRYERAVAALSEKLFGCGEILTEQERELFLYHVSSGTYGTHSIMVDNGMKKYASKDGSITLKSKLRYALSRLFPPAEFYEHAMPFVYRHRILIPFAAIYRIFARLITSLPNILREIKQVWNQGK